MRGVENYNILNNTFEIAIMTPQNFISVIGDKNVNISININNITCVSSKQDGSLVKIQLSDGSVKEVKTKYTEVLEMIEKSSAV